MIKILDGAAKNVIAIDLVDSYEENDEKLLEKLFDDKLATGLKQVNLLCKIDSLNLSKSSWKAMWDDSMYALKHMNNCGKIAIVSNKKWEEFLIHIDNSMFQNKKLGREEKYFHIDDLDKAMDWVNG